jgi:hypothetical protein
MWATSPLSSFWCEALPAACELATATYLCYPEVYLRIRKLDPLGSWRGLACGGRNQPAEQQDIAERPRQREPPVVHPKPPEWGRKGNTWTFGTALVHPRQLCVCYTSVDAQNFMPWLPFANLRL